MNNQITAAIQRHGARSVYNAACKRMDGNPAPLAAIGLQAADLAAANVIMSAAFAAMGHADRAIDLAQATSK